MWDIIKLPYNESNLIIGEYYYKKLSPQNNLLRFLFFICHKKKLLNTKELILIKKHYINLNLPMNIKEIFKKKDIDKIISFMEKDKKNLNEKINLVLIKRIGKTLKPNSVYINRNELKKFLVSNYI